MSYLHKIFAPKFILIWVLAAMTLFFSLTSTAFCSTDNLLEVLRSSGIIALLVLGLTWIVASGEIDVSYPQVAAFSSMLTALCLRNHLPWAISPVIAISAGTLFGLLSGVLVVKFKLPSLIATIGVSTVAGATAQLLGKAMPIYIMAIPKTIKYLVYGELCGVPVLIFVVSAIYLGFSYIQNHTTTGQHLYALGENRQATREAGISEGKILISFFALSALLASCGGVLLIASLNSGQPNLGAAYFIDGLTAVFLGAMIIKPGKPNVLGTLIGAILLSVLTNGLTLLGIKYFISYIIKGILMIMGIAIVAMSKHKALIRKSKNEKNIGVQ